jgi:hypothetical protein
MQHGSNGRGSDPADSKIRIAFRNSLTGARRAGQPSDPLWTCGSRDRSGRQSSNQPWQRQRRAITPCRRPLRSKAGVTYVHEDEHLSVCATESTTRLVSRSERDAGSAVLGRTGLARLCARWAQPQKAAVTYRRDFAAGFGRRCGAGDQLGSRLRETVGANVGGL